MTPRQLTQCLVVGGFIGAFAYNYIDPPRLSVRETKRDLIFKHIGSSNVEIKTTDGEVIRGYVGNSFNRGKGDGIILARPERVRGPDIGDETYTEEMGEYALIKESEIAYAAVEGETFDPEITKDDPDRLQELFFDLRRELCSSYSPSSLFSPPRKFLFYGLGTFAVVLLTGLVGLVGAELVFESPTERGSSTLTTFVGSLVASVLLWMAASRRWSLLLSVDRAYKTDPLLAMKSISVVVVPTLIGTVLGRGHGGSRIDSLVIGGLLTAGAVFLAITYRTHIDAIWSDDEETSADRLYLLLSANYLAAVVFFLAVVGRITDPSSTLAGRAAITVLSFVVVLASMWLFFALTRGGPSKKKPLSRVLYPPVVLAFETTVVTAVLAGSILLFPAVADGGSLLPIVFAYLAGFSFSTALLWWEPAAADDRDEPPAPAL